MNDMTDPRTPEQHWQAFKRSAMTQRDRGVVAYVEEMAKWEECGRLAWSSLTETDPLDATPEKLRADADRIESACVESGCSYDHLAECVEELRAERDALRAEVERIRESACARSDHLALEARAERAEAAVAAMRAFIDEWERGASVLGRVVHLEVDPGSMIGRARALVASTDVGAGMVSAPTAQAMAEALRAMSAHTHEDAKRRADALAAYEREVKQ